MNQLHFVSTAVEPQATPRGEIVIKNQNPPTSWTGTKYDMGLYRNGRRIDVKRGVHVGDQAVFCIPQTLYFSVSRRATGSSGCTEETTVTRAAFDMTHYLNGLKVTLSQKPGGGQHIFSGGPL